MNGSVTRADLGRLPAVLTVTQAAGLLGIGRSHAYEAVQTGEWPTRVIRIGRCIRIPAAEVLRLLGADPEAGGMQAWNLSVCRRRGLAFTDAIVDEHGDVIMRLRSGQTAVIQPAAGRELEILNRWDDFTLNVLSAEEERDLDRLDTDSWYGRFG